MISKKDKIHNKTIISIIISIAIISLSIMYILEINTLDGIHQYEAQRGFIDLNNWDKYEETNIFLDGEWEFYPNVLLMPEDDFSQYDNIKKYVQVPGSWESYLNDDGGVDGSGTYYLKINLPSDDIYGIKPRTIRYASRIFMNGEEVIAIGNPSTSRHDYVPNSIYKIGVNKSESQELDLIVHASSYGYTSGGIITPIEFGTYESILSHDQLDRGISAIVISALLVLGLFFLATYFQRGRGKELLYFSLTAIFLGIYMSTLGEQLLNSVLNYNHNERIQIQMASLMFVIPCILRCMYYVFEEYVNKKTINIITGLVLLSLSLAFLTVDGSVISIEFSQYFVLTTILISFIKIFYILIKSIVQNHESLEYILVIISSLFSCWIAMMFNVLLEYELGYLGFIIIFVVMISTSMLMGNKLQMDYKQAQSLSKKLIRDDKLKDEFLARASHELRTPLHVILNSTQSLIEGKNGTLNSKQQESLFFINQEGKRLTNLVSDLLDASRMNRGESHIRLRPFNAYRIVENILREMTVLIPKDKDILLINRIPDDLPTINGDPDKFTQIIYNLVSNAINHTESGEIGISASLNNGQAYFYIRDTGIGIKEEEKTEIFEVFYKSNDNNIEKTGMGLGLPITKHLVEIQGGEISVESTYGKGSSFIFNLPIYEGEKEYEEMIPIIKSVDSYESIIEPKDYNIYIPTILIVDDRLSNRKVLADILYDTDYNILFANDGKEAIETLDKSKVDLIVLDYMLPDISGDEICKKIREKYSLVELPILMLTASERTIDMKYSFDHGANDFLRKPADSEELKSRIKSLLSMKKSVEDGLSKEFKYFYSQISPHFLFNTLNTIIGLSYKDSKKARQALNNLSIYFRGKLEMYKDKILIPIKSELELVTAYLEIEKLRYGDRLKVEIDIDEDIDSMIPPLTLQPLVENSIRHGISAKGNGCIRITVKSHEDSVIINIEDDGIGMNDEKQEELLSGGSERLGFRNVMEKIKIIKGARLELESKESEGTKIRITIPEVSYDASYISG